MSRRFRLRDIALCGIKLAVRPEENKVSLLLVNAQALVVDLPGDV